MVNKKKKVTYQDQRDDKADAQTEVILEELPGVVTDFMAYESTKATSLTRYGYACDLKLFFNFLTDKIDRFQNMDAKDITPELLSSLTLVDLDRYAVYLKRYKKEDDDGNTRTVKNGNVGIARKYSALRSFFKYMFTHGFIKENVAANLEMPKIRKKKVVYLELSEIEDLFETVNSGDGLTARQRAYNENFKRRDIAILSLLLGTGIRESELIGIDITDVDFARRKFNITRKGEKTARLAMSQSVMDAIEDYMTERNKIVPEPGHENALFLSSQKKRLSPRALQDIVKKYAKAACPFKEDSISVHKLRSSYATNHLRKGKNIYMTSRNLGHEKIETTLHYIGEEETNSEQAAEVVDWV